jgi:hypothetical protein
MIILGRCFQPPFLFAIARKPEACQRGHNPIQAATLFSKPAQRKKKASASGGRVPDLAVSLGQPVRPCRLRIWPRAWLECIGCPEEWNFVTSPVAREVDLRGRRVSLSAVAEPAAMLGTWLPR